MSVIGELVGEVVCTLLGGVFFVTGELLLSAITLGRHRVRWWEVQDGNVGWGPALLGFAFWTGLTWLLVRLLL